MSEVEIASAVSDAELITRVRGGETDAFAELWRRHYRPAHRAAALVARWADPDDLLSEAYLRVYQQIIAGGGPHSAFRPYLYSVIRNLARARVGDTDTDPLDDDPVDPFSNDDPLLAALDRSLTAQAFRSLPDRWQAVLWYTEIEHMEPREVAPLLGLSANGVAALAYRAREGLREAWLQAHVSSLAAEEECRWVLERLGRHARNKLGDREQIRVDAHLAGCTSCLVASAEVDDVASRLALVTVPLVLGVGGGFLFDQLSQPGVSAVAEAIAPSVPGTADAHPSAGLAVLGVTALALSFRHRTRGVRIAAAIALVVMLALGTARGADAWSDGTGDMSTNLLENNP